MRRSLRHERQDEILVVKTRPVEMFVCIPFNFMCFRREVRISETRDGGKGAKV